MKNGRKPHQTPRPEPQDVDLRPRGALEAHVEQLAKSMLGVTAAEAYAKLDRGELHGSIAEAELSMVRPEFEAARSRRRPR